MMIRISLAAGAMALLAAVPAIAQTSTTSSGAMSSGTAMKSDNSAMTCDQMMAKAQKMSTSGTGARMTIMQNQMSMAQKAKAANDEAGCKMHAQKAMDAMK